MSEFLLAAAVLAAFLALHPFTTFPASLWLARALGRRSSLPAAADAVPARMALLFCAYNEERVIGEKIANLRALKRRLPDLAIYAYVDAATDRTAALLAAHPDLLTLVEATERLGKTAGMNRLVQMSEAEILVFTDANVMLDAEGLARLPGYFADPTVGCVCGHLLYLPDDSPTASVGSLYWRFEEWIKQLESDTGSAMGADGSIFAIRRGLRHDPPPDMIDDVFVSLAVLLQGYRIVRAPDVLAYERSASEPKEEFARKIRIACRSFNVHRVLWPSLRRLDPWNLYKYVSHKLLRWLSIYFLGLAAVLFSAWLLATGHGALALTLWGAIVVLLAVALFTRAPVLAPLGNIALALLGTGIGVWKSLTGRRMQTWTPASSVRKTDG